MAGMKSWFFPLCLSFVLTACAPMQGEMIQQDAQLPPPAVEETPQHSVTAGKEEVFFAAQSSELSRNEHEKLKALATAMRMDKTLRARLSGSTENGSNPSLALRRAIAVRNILSQMGVRPDRLSVKDEGRSDTILSQQHPENGKDSSGRRVDIVIESVTGQAI
jgi:outer membrane protein OmpA-like peptidoglycan-associated protein